MVEKNKGAESNRTQELMDLLLKIYEADLLDIANEKLTEIIPQGEPLKRRRLFDNQPPEEPQEE